MTIAEQRDRAFGSIRRAFETGIRDDAGIVRWVQKEHPDLDEDFIKTELEIEVKGQ